MKAIEIEKFSEEKIKEKRKLVTEMKQYNTE